MPATECFSIEVATISQSQSQNYLHKRDLLQGMQQSVILPCASPKKCIKNGRSLEVSRHQHHLKNAQALNLSYSAHNLNYKVDKTLPCTSFCPLNIQMSNAGKGKALSWVPQSSTQDFFVQFYDFFSTMSRLLHSGLTSSLLNFRSIYLMPISISICVSNKYLKPTCPKLNS